MTTYEMEIKKIPAVSINVLVAVEIIINKGESRDRRENRSIQLCLYIFLVNFVEKSAIMSVMSSVRYLKKNQSDKW